MAEGQRQKLREALEFELCFVSAPHEALLKFVKVTQKSLEKELLALTKQVREMASKTKAAAKLCSASGEAEEGASVLRSHVYKLLKPMTERMHSLREKLVAARGMEKRLVQHVTWRVKKLQELSHSLGSESDTADADAEHWYELRLERLVVHHLLREGRFDTAKVVVDESPLGEDAKRMVDLEVFHAIQRVVEGLRNHSTAKALKWCGENRTKLGKISSSLEFNLRLQGFLELVRDGTITEAVDYARKYLMPHLQTNGKLILQAMGMLAFLKNDVVPIAYKSFFEESRWNVLEEEFLADAHRVCNLSEQSLLNDYLAAGLTVLKTGACMSETGTTNCPLCQPPYAELATHLPTARWQTSMIKCRITGKLINEDNAGLALPNGYVYSSDAMQQLLDADGTTVTCPRTGAKFQLSDATKIFIT